jgi:WD40 repeat protein
MEDWPALQVQLSGHYGPIRSVVFSVDGKRIASGSDDKTIRVCDAATGQTVAGPFKGHTGPVSSVAFSADGKFIASGSLDATIRVWNLPSTSELSTPGVYEGSSVAAVGGKCPLGELFVVTLQHHSTRYTGWNSFALLHRSVAH